MRNYATITYVDGMASTDSQQLPAKIYVDTWNMFEDETNTLHQALISLLGIEVSEIENGDSVYVEQISWHS